MIIYKTINLINGHYYIGKDQKNNDFYLGSGLALNRAIQKYGRENFKKIILEQCSDPEHLKQSEIFWIEQYNATDDPSSYNIAKGGHGGHTGAYHKVGRKVKDNPMYGKQLTEEQRKAIGQRSKEFHKNEDPIKKAERIEKSKLKQKGRPKNPKSVTKMKASKYHNRGKGYGLVTVYTLHSPNNETFIIKTKDKLKEFCEEHCLSFGTLESRILKGRKMQSGCMIGWTASRSKEILLP